MQHNGLFVGLTTIDIQYFVPSFPEPNTKIKSEKPSVWVGGPATNAAVAFSFFNGSTNLISAVGESPFREFVMADLASNRIVHTDLLEGQEHLPVLATVVTTDHNGDRTIFTYNPDDCCLDFSPEELLGQLNPDFVFTDGFYPTVALAFCKAARKREIPVIFDGGSWKDHLGQLLPWIDVAICSSNFIPPGCNTTDDVFACLNRWGGAASAISRGHKSLLFQDGKQSGEIEIQEILAADTLGAGDFLHGAFCYFYSRNNSFEAALRQASVFASETCRYKGTRIWQEKLDAGYFL
jgi:sugar/nucleoside kinase (ribokinase family)